MTTKSVATETSSQKNKWRPLWVVLWAIFGGSLATWFVFSVEESQSKIACIIKDNDLVAPLFLLIISAPLSLYLWLCRNKDKLKQIAQADEQNKFNSFSNAIRLFLEKDEENKDNKKGKDGNLHTKAVGLMLLAKIKSENNAFDAEIDMATSGANLKNVDLTNADLARINLSRSVLSGVFLTKANLLNTDLAEANLTSASMLGINLTGANLKDATLNDLVIGIDEEYVYDEDKKQPLFTRAEIEDYLKKDWKEHKTQFPAQVKEKEKNKTYYFERRTNLPPDMTDSSLKKPSPKRRGRPPKHKGDLPKPKEPSSASTLPSKAPTARSASADLPTAPTAPSPKTPNTTKTLSNLKEVLYFPVRATDLPARRVGEADTYFHQAKSKFDNNDLDGTIEDCDKAIELDPRHVGAYRLRALVKLRKGME